MRSIRSTDQEIADWGFEKLAGESMKVLLDTQSLFWWFGDDSRLSKRAGFILSMRPVQGYFR